MSSPTSRTLDRCRDMGAAAQVVERWNAYAKRRIDLFGVIDVVSIHAEDGCLGIQACAGTDASKRVDKALAEPRLKVWLSCGNRFEVWAWRKTGARGKRKLWSVRRVAVRLEAGELRAENLT